MTTERPFRFAVRASPGIREPSEWRELAESAEALGYRCLMVTDHMDTGFAPLIALLYVSSFSATLRVGAEVLDNDFRNPLLLAKEAATLDVLTGGRLELGLGAGWRKADYDWSGITFDDGATRVARLEEAVPILKALLSGEAITHEGRFYRMRDATCHPRPLQRPHPPIMIGGTGRRLLRLAAYQADVVSFATGTSAQPPAEWTLEALAGKAARVRALSGDRGPELHLSPDVCRVTSDRDRYLGERARQLGFATAEDLGRSAYVLVGTVERIVEQLEETRAATGISYVTVHHGAMKAFAPVVAQLAGR